MTILDYLKAEPDLKQIFSRMGFKPGKAEIPATMKPLVDEAIAVGRRLLRPRAIYDFRPVKFHPPHRIEVRDAFTIESEKVYRWMEGSTGMYLTAVTLGPELDQKIAAYSASNEVTRAFLLNAYGAEAAEALMAQLNRELSALAETQGWKTTKRYSPGYGDWHISGQKGLLDTLAAEKIGIHLTDQYMMIPEKSVSAVIGVKPARGDN